ncbi:uncharacterized protein LOC124280417 isoform X3 [Haliotis rubra]|uniref:uncharacterized protein LOC124280417 isoform X3 n=1 Tax=Haliotis rubra TaxID=36100 RepID=UPI001EE60CC0|nr:uncharacterized protein LOC124280417 isoform X3 [Haliotis rubra]
MSGSSGSPSVHMEGCCDITITRHLWKFLEDGHNRSERCPAVAFIRCDWADGGSKNRSVTHTTRWKLHVCAPDTQQTDESDVFRLLGSDTFTHLHHFTDRLWKEHDTELTHIERGLIFACQHRQYSEEKMDGFKRNILASFQHLINTPSTHRNYAVSLELLEEKSGYDNGGRTSTLSDTQLELQRIEDRLQERMSCELRNMENLVRTLIQTNQTYMEGEVRNIALAVRSEPDERDAIQVSTEGVASVHGHVLEADERDAIQVSTEGVASVHGHVLEADERDATPLSTEGVASVHGHVLEADKRDATPVSTEGVSNVQGHVPETDAGAPPKGDPARSGGTSVNDQRESPVPETTDSYRDNRAEGGNDNGLEEMPGSRDVDQNIVPTTGLDDTLETHTSWLSSENIQQMSPSEIISTHPTPPRTNSAVTVLCVDVSESIGEKGLREMKQTVNRFIDGIETMAEQQGLEENIGLVAMGGDVTVMQDITNDYGRVRDAIDDLVLRGASPIFEAIVVSVASIKNRAGILRIGGIHKVKPRIIFFTDGFATSEDHPDGPDSVINDSNLKVQIIRLTTMLAREKSDTDPLIWVPVGNADTTFLSSLAKLGNQELVEGKDIHSLCSRYRLQDTIAKIYLCLEKSFSKDRERTERNIEAVAEAFMGDMTHEEKVFVIKAVTEKIEKKDGILPDDGPSDYDNVLEREGLPPLGSRVIRGPDWKYGDQDVEGPGTVVNHANDHQFLWVRWDLYDSNCRYRYGYEEQFDVLLVDQSRRLAANELIEIGVKVKRGTDWSYGNQDGGPGGRGMVIRKRKDGRVKVRWDNGHINSYNFGSHGEFDLEISSEEDELSAVIAASLEETASPSRVPDEEVKGTLQTEDRPHIVWQWRDDSGVWRLYTHKQIEKLERDYSRTSARTCVLQKGDQSFRITFKEPMSQKSSNDGRRYDVQRLAVSTKDLDQLISQTSAVEDVGWMWADKEYVQ